MKGLLHLCLVIFMLTGCRRGPDGATAGESGHGHTESAPGKPDAHGHSHGHGESEGASGASFKEGQGVLVKDEAKKLLGIEVVDVAEREMPAELRTTIQIFGERHNLNSREHDTCLVQGAAFVATNAAAVLKAGQSVELRQGTNAAFAGTVLGVPKSLTLGEAEIVIGISNAAASLKPGDFVSALVKLPLQGPVPSVPVSALLRTAEGTYVYAVNGDAYFRTAVKTGIESGGWVEITDGLLAGDQVVVQPVQALWLIELRATKGGGHSH
ncbi:MAG: efflux RND transporter periplasmic adaptor subunit [Verrucomicrobiae bacterium]|nr:efflux RND transporter periplasmic adaptor subunit [Verrucomicrobiae bacterium]